MSRRTRIMRGLSKASYAIALMVFGAQALAQYFILTQPSPGQPLRNIQAGLWLTFWIFLVGGKSLDRRDASSDYREPTSRQSGVAVVVVTGVTASIAVARSNYVYGLLIAAVTLIVATAVWRFATAHASDIGEARFTADAVRS